MTKRTVTTQAELDQALADKVDRIDIRSPGGVWLEIRRADSSTVRAFGSSTVWAFGSSTVWASDFSTVTASGSSTVTAYGSSTVWASGSSTVTAFDSSTVTASDSSTVWASGSSTVTAFDSSTVTAGSHTAVRLHSVGVHLTGGVVIDHTNVNQTDPKQWAEYHGVHVEDGIATLYKAVDDKWTTTRGADYSPGTLPEAPDWRDDNECGGGLHFGPTPSHALAYHPEATRFVEVGVRLEDLRPIVGGTAKCKAPRVVRACREVDAAGRPV